jgi:hypothetical protein
MSFAAVLAMRPEANFTNRFEAAFPRASLCIPLEDTHTGSCPDRRSRRNLHQIAPVGTVHSSPVEDTAMKKRLRNPTDPEVLEEILSSIRATTREEWIERLSRYPDWDPAWADGGNPDDHPATSNGTAKVNAEVSTLLSSR